MSNQAAQDVTMKLINADSGLHLYEDGIDLSKAKQMLTLNGEGSTLLQTDQTWKVGAQAALMADVAIGLGAFDLTLNVSGIATIAGVLTGSGNLTQTGSGTLTLAGNASYSGATQIKGGTLIVSGLLEKTSGVFISSGASLAGTGTLTSSVTVDQGATLSPGPGIGTLTLSAGLSLAGDIAIDIDSTASPSSDRLILSGATQFKDTARVVILTAKDAPEGGEVFQVFDTAMPGTDSLEIVGELTKGLYWENRLAIDGTLVVKDFDECEGEGVGNDCHENAGCSNSPGGFVCTCLPGYTGDGYTCEDEDECALETDSCDPNASCSNTDGGFECVCNAGYLGDGSFCEDEDECALEKDNCHINALCENTVGGFVCTCAPGYEGDGKGCTDLNECTDGTQPCNENATCENTEGSFVCSCNEGFVGDGLTCCADSDGDTVCDTVDNCPDIPNTEQENTDGDLVGNACECTDETICDDDNPCTDDNCAPETGCVFVANTGECDDGNPCTQSSCYGGECIIVSATDGCCDNHSDCGGGSLICDAKSNDCITASCAACSTDSDCGEGANACVTLGGMNRCAIACVDDAGCPEGTACTDVVDGASTRHCIPVSGSCDCMPTEDTLCEAGNLHVRDSCGGVGVLLETCGEAGCGDSGCCPEGTLASQGSCKPVDDGLGPDPPSVKPPVDDPSIQGQAGTNIDGEAQGCTTGTHPSAWWISLLMLLVCLRRRLKMRQRSVTAPS